jgi:uncharacterized protein
LEDYRLFSPREHLEAVPSENVSIETGLWGQHQATNQNQTIPAIYNQLKKTGRFDAWHVEHKRERPKKHAIVHIFGDSDSGKWLEAVGHSLRLQPNSAFEAQADEVIDLIEKAQQSDGYLNSYFTAVEPGNRWRNLRDYHEMYNAGHLLEGAVAYYEATGKTKILDVLRRYIDHIDERFGPKEGQRHGYDGHPEIELAVMKLYRLTKEPRYLDLAKYFIDQRGQEPHYFDQEAKERGEDPADFWAQTYHYCQAHEPLRDQQTSVGHAVRACYLYAGLADVALETGDPTLLETARRLWDDLTQHQMYITGGLGPAHSNEGFTFAYDLPNETAYAETCASIALVFWAQRMFHLDPHGRYIDVMERALYNGVLSGVSHEGTEFFYANPLVSYPKINPFEQWKSVASSEHYRRSEWFTCPCCPPNLARLVASIGAYMYSVTPDTLFVHLYNQNRANVTFSGQDIEIEQTTNYPWDGEIQLAIHTSQPTEFELALRIPGWCRDYKVAINGETVEAAPNNGYVHVKRTWANGDTVTLSLNMPVERMASHPDVRMNAGQIALQRGPVVYCLEEVDNGPRLANVVIPPDSELTATFDPSLFGGITVITGEAMRIEPANWSQELYQPQSRVNYTPKPFTLRAIPYHLWANRQPGEMRVWIREV